jgi:hypothetical protein
MNKNYITWEDYFEKILEKENSLPEPSRSNFIDSYKEKYDAGWGHTDGVEVSEEGITHFMMTSRMYTHETLYQFLPKESDERAQLKHFCDSYNFSGFNDPKVAEYIRLFVRLYNTHYNSKSLLNKIVRAAQS